MPKKYTLGIQKSVLEIIRQSKRMKLRYITKTQIVEQIKKIRPDIQDADRKVTQALYQLQKETKYGRPVVEKYYDRKGRRKGWTISNI